MSIKDFASLGSLFLFLFLSLSLSLLTTPKKGFLGSQISWAIELRYYLQYQKS